MKKNKYVLCFILTLSCIWAHPSMATKLQCTLVDNPQPEHVKAYTQCLDAKLNTVQQQQDSWIQKRTFELSELANETGNTHVSSLFKQSIIAKDKFIQKSCQWRYMLKQPNTLQAAVAYKECEIALIEQFIEQLKTAL